MTEMGRSKPNGIVSFRACFDYTHVYSPLVDNSPSWVSLATFDVDTPLIMTAEFEAEITEFIKQKYDLDAECIGCTSCQPHSDGLTISTYRWEYPIRGEHD